MRPAFTRGASRYGSGDQLNVRHSVKRMLCYECAVQGDMERAIIQSLTEFIEREILAGEGADLTDSTPLLALGILDSFSLLALIGFVNREYGVRIDLAAVDPSDLSTLTNIASLVMRSRP